MQILITDANIFIDFYAGNLIQNIFAIKADICTPDILFYQELHDQHAELLIFGLKLSKLPPDTIKLAISLNQKYPTTSIYDCFALALAKSEDCPLLTGDAHLRNAAAEETVKIKGSIWLMEQMIIEKLISLRQAENAFNLMKNANRRLPWKAAEKLLEKYALLK